MNERYTVYIVFILCTIVGVFATADVKLHPATGNAYSIRPFTPFKLSSSDGKRSSNHLLTDLNIFFNIYGHFNVRNAPAELTHRSTFQDPHHTRKQHTHFSQVHNGVPVIGSFMKVHVSEDDIEFVNGVFIPDITTNTIPSVTKSVASETALHAVSSKYQKRNPLISTPETLQVHSSIVSLYHTGLAQGITGDVKLVYDVMITSKIQHNPIRERVFVDANSGEVLNMFSTLNKALERKIWYYNFMYGYPDNEDVGVVAWKEGDPLPANKDQQEVLKTAQLAYNIFKNVLGWDSYDNKGAVMNAVYNFSSPYCPNAFWSGDSIILCPGFAVYDVLVHEWTHGYTMFMDELLYQYESGALNEAISDIVAETAQILTGLPQPYAIRTNDSCINSSESSLRWIVGDEMLDIIAVYPEMEPYRWGLRDAYNPNCIEYGDGKGSPRSTYDPVYLTGSDDAGGVHGNSGVINQGYSLLADGGSLNGTNITGIGLIKALHIFLRAKAVYNGAVTTFAQHADAIKNSCSDLLGLPLVDPITGATSSEIIVTSDCDQIENVIVATGLRHKPVYPQLVLPTVRAFIPRHVPIYKPGYYQFQFPQVLLLTELFNTSEISTALAKFDGSANGLRYGECWTLSNVTLGCAVPFSFNTSQTVTMSIKVGETETQGAWSDPITLNLFENPKIENIVLISEANSSVVITGTGFQEFEGCEIPDSTDIYGKAYDCLVCIFGHYTGPDVTTATYINSSAVSCALPPQNGSYIGLKIFLGSGGTNAPQFAGAIGLITTTSSSSSTSSSTSPSSTSSATSSRSSSSTSSNPTSTSTSSTSAHSPASRAASSTKGLLMSVLLCFVFLLF